MISAKSIEIDKKLKISIQFGSTYDPALDKVYRAPEALQGKYSDKSDVFSLGVIVYKLLTLRDPFTVVELESQ